MEKPRPPEDLWQKLDEARAQLPVQREPPAGSFSISDYAAKYGLARATAGDQVRNLTSKGILEVAGVIGNQKFYRLV